MPLAAGTAEAVVDALVPEPVPVPEVPVAGVVLGTSPVGDSVQRESLPPLPQNWVLSPLQMAVQLVWPMGEVTTLFPQ